MDDKQRPVPYPLRMPEDLRTRLEEAAKASGRSINAEAVARLVASFEASGGHTLEKAVSVLAGEVTNQVHLRLLQEAVMRLRFELAVVHAEAPRQQQALRILKVQLDAMTGEDSERYRNTAVALEMARIRLDELAERRKALQIQLQKAEAELKEAEAEASK